MNRTLATSAVLAAAALAAGCGPAASSNSAKSFSGPQKPVAQAIDDFAKAARNNDEKQICTSLLARGLSQKLDATAQRCTGAVSDQLDAAGDYTIDVKRITINGNNATAQVVSKVAGHDRPQTLTLVRQDGSWRLSGVR